MHIPPVILVRFHTTLIGQTPLCDKCAKKQKRSIYSGTISGAYVACHACGMTENDYFWIRQDALEQKRFRPSNVKTHNGDPRPL